MGRPVSRAVPACGCEREELTGELLILGQQTSGSGNPPEFENGFALSIKDISERFLEEYVRFGGSRAGLEASA